MSIKNIRAGFWRRFAAKAIDIILAGLLIIVMSLIFIDMEEVKFRQDWMFYVWVLFFGIILFTICILIPIIWNGVSIGNKFLKIKVISEDKISSVILKRELFFTLAWIFLLLLIAIIINHTLIIEYLKTDRPILTEWEDFRITIITTFGGLIAFIQLGLGISLLASSKNESFHDTTSNSKVIIINQFQKEEEKPKIILPVSVNNEDKYEWIE